MKTDTKISNWDKLMMAIAFAEEGEHETARDLLSEREDRRRPEIGKKQAVSRPELRS